MDLTAVLQAAQSADSNARQQAEQTLTAASSSSFPSYLASLAGELANGEKPESVRQIAGILLKNALDSPGADATKKGEQAQRWLQLEGGVKQHIKQSLLATLPAKEPSARHTAALVLAKVAAIELPTQQWPDLVKLLLSNMSVTPPDTGLRQSTLQTLGYICEEMAAIHDDVLSQEEINAVLTAVVQGMQKNEMDNDVRLAATVALYNALEFAHSNFNNDSERNYLMQVICEGTNSQDVRVREASFECFVKIASSYYDKLPPYMDTIFQLTHNAVKNDEEDVAKQAIEFWCSICEEETAIQEDIDDGDTSQVHHRFVAKALQPLVALLLEQLVKQEEGQDLDDTVWNVSMAAGVCLGLVAMTVRDDIIPLVITPFVQPNIDKNTGPDDWRYREAATFVFGCILEGPSPDQLAQLVVLGLNFLLQAMKDQKVQVRHTTAWTIGRIFEFVHGSGANPPVITPANLPPIIETLLAAFKDEHHIAEKVCYAFSQLAAGFKDSDTASPLSPYFKDIVQALLETAARQAESTRLQAQAFEAINEVVRCASPDTLPMVGQLIPLMINKLNETLAQQPSTPEAIERQSEIQGLLCGVLQVIIQKLSETDATKPGVLQFGDAIMEVLLRVFACRSATVHEEALLAVGAFTYTTGKQFVKYMDSFFPVLQTGLTNHQDWQVCQVSVGVLGDVCRAIEEAVAPYCDRVMAVLLANLQSDAVHRNIKPQILSAFGDVALAIGDKFEAYLSHCLTMLASAQALSVQQQQTGDEDFFDYNNLLRHGILEAYSGILNGLSRDKVNQHLVGAATGAIDFVEYLFNDKANQDSTVNKTAVALLGDLASSLTGVGALFQQKPAVVQFVREAQASSDAGLSDTADWAAQVIQKCMA
jgi:importin subunit beta-1